MKIGLIVVVAVVVAYLKNNNNKNCALSTEQNRVTCTKSL